MRWPRSCGGEEVGIYYSTEREGHDAKGTTNVYERVQAGNGAPDADQRQEHHAGRTRPGIADSTLHHWCKLLAEQGEQAFPGSGHQTAQEEELCRLKRELEVVRQERNILKSSSHLLTGCQMKYRFIAQHHQEYPVTTMCQVLEVSVSGYYAWKQRSASARQIADQR